MDSVSDTPEERAQDKSPAPVIKATPGAARVSAVGAKKPSAKKAPAKKAPAKAAPAKKAVAKAAPAKKAAAKKPPAKAVPSKGAPAKATSVKKAVAKKAVAKKAPAKKPAPKKVVTPKVSGETTAEQLRLTEPVATSAHQTVAPEPVVATEPKMAEPKVAEPIQPQPKRTQPKAEPRYRASEPLTGPMAMVASFTEEMANDLLPFLIGAGVPIDPLDTTISLPGMGDIEVRLGLTVTAVNAIFDPANDGRVKVVVAAAGEVATRTVDFEGDTVSTTSPVVAAASAMLPSTPIPVIGEALVAPFMYLNESGRIAVGLDLSRAEFISIATDQSAPAPEGVVESAWPGMLAMFGVLLGGIGADLFEALSEHVGEAMVELDEEIGSVFVELGGKPGPLGISVASGLVTISLPASDSVRGHALPVPIAGKRVGVGLASSVVDHVAHIALSRAAGDLPLPFELDVTLDEQSVGGRIKNTRIFPESLPDLRGALRTDVRTRLLRGQLELSVQAAWIEMPSIVPSFVNQISKKIGGLVSLAPLKVKFPAVIPVPLPDDAGSLEVKVDDLRVTSNGIGLVASLA